MTIACIGLGIVAVSVMVCGGEPVRDGIMDGIAPGGGPDSVVMVDGGGSI